MECYDFCVAWNWEHDGDFTGLLDGGCRLWGISFLQVTPENLGETIAALSEGRLVFRVLLDRASDVDGSFWPLVSWAKSHSACFINRPEDAYRTRDKAAMHHQLIRAGLHTPYTIVLPALSEQSALTGFDFAPLGGRFAIKPAHGGGGAGVVREAYALSAVHDARRVFPDDQYLLQEFIVPARLASRQAWFRIIHTSEEIYPFWWDPGTHVYVPVTAQEEAGYGLAQLRVVAERIADLCGLELFSTEVARVADGRLIVVDYVNDPVDLRLQSRAPDGVPDRVVAGIASHLVRLAVRHCYPSVATL